MQEQVPTSANNQTHPLMKTKQANNKMSVSSSNLEDSIGGIVGNRIH